MSSASHSCRSPRQELLEQHRIVEALNGSTMIAYTSQPPRSLRAEATAARTASRSP